ncbi:MAG: hypothetical protein RLZZ157_1694 [Pseudomonadota bacterium]|jgi:hypothetical protein
MVEEAKGLASPVGSSFDAFLHDEGLYDDVQAGAVKKVMVFQLQAAMKEKKITKVEMAKRMKTSRSQLDRLLDPGNEAVSLEALTRAAKVVGRQLSICLV